MVFKIINESTAWNGDLFNPADFYGTQDDTILVDPAAPFTLQIKTYGGHDHLSVLDGPQRGFMFADYWLGKGNDTLLGSGAAEHYIDQRGDDLVGLGGGNDIVSAGRGDDTINAGAGGEDSVWFFRISDDSGGYSFNTQGVNFDLAKTTAQDLGLFGTDIYRNFEQVIGSYGADTLLGTNGNNILEGSSGNDHLRGREGYDTIAGGPGLDVLIGDVGADDLFGGRKDDPFDGSRDVFKFYRLADSKTSAMDSIFGFETAENGRRADKIKLSAIDANPSQDRDQAFAFIGNAQFHRKGGEVRIVEFGGSTIVFVDDDNDAAAEMAFVVANVTGLTQADFIL
jgi:Ca2+-binding RTX toxin-like protein